MRKIINSTYISLDGVVEHPHKWSTFERPSDERSDQIQTTLLSTCDAALVGRRTYDSFAPAWQGRSGDPLSDRMNAITKYDASTTLTDPDWTNTIVISSEVADRIQQLKHEPGQNIVQYGFGAISTLLMEHGLLDELRLWIHPLFVGNGSSDDLLFPKGPPTHFELVDSITLKSSMVILTYQLAS
jgi:dihydrofolate reductase